MEVVFASCRREAIAYQLLIDLRGKIVKKLQPVKCADAIRFAMAHDDQVFVWGDVNELPVITQCCIICRLFVAFKPPPHIFVKAPDGSITE